MKKNNREQALEWWRSFNTSEQYAIIKDWKSFSSSRMSKWTPIMIQHSSSCIELMFTEFLKNNNNKMPIFKFI